MKLDPDMHIGMHLVFFGKSGVTFKKCKRDLQDQKLWQEIQKVNEQVQEAKHEMKKFQQSL
jgi:hypothetical protein